VATENIYAVCSAADWGDPNWAGKADQAARDAYYDGTYTSLAGWEAGRNGDLTAGNTAETAEILGDDWSGSPDGNVDIAGWTCDRSNAEIYTVKTVDNGFSPSAKNDYGDGKWDTTNYIISEEGSDETIDFAVATARQDGDWYGVQIEMTSNSNENMLFRAIGPSSELRFYKCYFKHDGTNANNENVQTIADTDLTLTFMNCILMNADSGVECLEAGNNTLNHAYFYNCTITGGSDGIAVTESTRATIKKCAVLGNAANFSGGAQTIDYCASDTGDGTNSQTLDTSSGYAAEFTDYANGDYRPVSGGVCVNNGVDNPSTGLYSDDITETARVSTWDIGAFECIATPTAGIVVQASAHLINSKKTKDMWIGWT
jgi:hypothetical protein